MPWHLRHLNPALLNRQGMSTHPKMENGSELCHWKGQLVIGLRASPVRPRKPPQIGAKLGTLRGSTTWRNVKAPPHRHVSSQHGLAKSMVIHIAYIAREMVSLALKGSSRQSYLEELLTNIRTQPSWSPAFQVARLTHLLIEMRDAIASLPRICTVSTSELYHY